jgi:hypothetical protein
VGDFLEGCRVLAFLRLPCLHGLVVIALGLLPGADIRTVAAVGGDIVYGSDGTFQDYDRQSPPGLPTEQPHFAQCAATTAPPTPAATPRLSARDERPQGMGRLNTTARAQSRRAVTAVAREPSERARDRIRSRPGPLPRR